MQQDKLEMNRVPSSGTLHHKYSAGYCCRIVFSHLFINFYKYSTWEAEKEESINNES
jgi:hypothetical protein